MHFVAIRKFVEYLNSYAINNNNCLGTAYLFKDSETLNNPFFLSFVFKGKSFQLTQEFCFLFELNLLVLLVISNLS